MDVRLPHLNRIPGISIAAKEKYVQDLSTYSIVQLNEILDRESKLLHDKKRLARLPDKGKRILDFHAKVTTELESRNDIEKAAKLFSNLNIAAEGIKVVTKMEWNGKYDPTASETQSVLDSDDDEETDPLKILAQSRDVRKHIKVIRPQLKLITDADLAEINAGAADSATTADGIADPVQLEPHAVYLCEMESHHGNKTKYFPYKTTTSNVHSMEAEKARKMGKHWEITAATPPPIRNSSAKVLSLQESIDIQKKQYDMLKEVEQQFAKDRLEARENLTTKVTRIRLPNDGRDLNEFFRTYREFVESDEDLDDDDNGSLEINSDDEVHDEEPPSGGVVSFVVHE